MQHGHAVHRAERFAVKPTLVAVVVLASLGLVGCADLQLAKNLDLPPNGPGFKNRLYAGAAVGRASLKPNLNGMDRFSVQDDVAASTQLRLGYDVHNTLAVELDSSILGTSQLAQNDIDVKYSAATASALIYGLNGVQDRSRRQGWSAYGRVGLALVRRASRLVPLDGSETLPIVGVGAEYGLKSGLGLRGEITRFDSDAIFTGIGMVYRFGLTPRQIGGVIAQAAQPALHAGETRVLADGRGVARLHDRPPTVIDRDEANAPPTLAAALPPVWPEFMIGDDTDRDGVADAGDLCGDTLPATLVDERGCGLFDGVLDDVTFKPASAWLNPQATRQLDRLAETLLAFPEVRVQIRAHTDNRGADSVNRTLSRSRAQVVADYLHSRGVSAVQMEPVGLGSLDPLVNNDTREKRARNRRVDLMTLPNLSPAQMNGRALIARQEPRPHLPRPLVPNADELLAVDNKALPLTLLPPALAHASISAREPAFLPPVRRAAQVAAVARAVQASEAPALAAARPEPGRPVPVALPASRVVPGLSLGGVVRGVGFATGSTELTASAQDRLRAVHTKLEQFPDVRVAIMAHTDDLGSRAVNQRLSERRAAAVKAWIVSQGTDSERVVTEGYGEDLPRVQNVTQKDRALNRRIEIRILP